jgi:hypothetical protein
MGGDPKFFVSVDPPRGFTRVILEGFLEPQEIAEFANEFRTAKTSIPFGPERHLTLIDISEFKIQAQSVADGFAAMLADPAIRSRRLAFIVGDSPVRMQLRRMLHENARIFDDELTAEAWLFEGDTA